MSRQAAPASRSAPRAPVLWGIVVGLLQAATPLAFWWLASATVYALGLIVIASVYVGFAVADGRPKVIAVESSVNSAFVIVAGAAGALAELCSALELAAVQQRLESGLKRVGAESLTPTRRRRP